MSNSSGNMISRPICGVIATLVSSSLQEEGLAKVSKTETTLLLLFLTVPRMSFDFTKSRKKGAYL